MTTTTATFALAPFAAVRARLLAREETALLDVREEDPFAQEHPLWAANLPLSRIEIEAWRRIPRLDTFIVLYGAHGGKGHKGKGGGRGRHAEVVDLSSAERSHRLGSSVLE